MSPVIHGNSRAWRSHDEVSEAIVAGPWNFISFADGLLERKTSTVPRLGMPIEVSEIEDVLAGFGSFTVVLTNVGCQYWDTYLSATETGATFLAPPGPVQEEVQRLRDEVARRTRLTRQQISRALGVDRRTLSSWANGTTIPTADRLERLRYLAATVREMDALRPGEATNLLLAQRWGGDILDLIARSEFVTVRNWQGLEPGRAVVEVKKRTSARPEAPFYANALAAYLEGRLNAPPRARGIRESTEYEQDLSEAHETFPDENLVARRGRYR